MRADVSRIPHSHCRKVFSAVCPRGSRAPLGKLGVTQQIRAGALSSAVKTPGVRWESSARSAVRPSVRPPEQPCGTAAPHRTAPRHSGPAAPPGAPTAARCSVLRSVPRRSPQPPPLRGAQLAPGPTGRTEPGRAVTRVFCRGRAGCRSPGSALRGEGRHKPGLSPPPLSPAGPDPAAGRALGRPRPALQEAAVGPSGAAGAGQAGGGAALSSWRGRRKCRVPGRGNGVGAQQ